MVEREVYIIEDDNDDFIFMSEALRHVAPQVGYKRFSNAGELFAHLTVGERKVPALFIIDYNLPLLNGVELMQRLNNDETFTSVPKVFYSNSTFGQHRLDAFNHGAVAYFTKGVDMDDIRQELLEMLVYSSPSVL